MPENDTPPTDVRDLAIVELELPVSVVVRIAAEFATTDEVQAVLSDVVPELSTKVARMLERTDRSAENGHLGWIDDDRDVYVKEIVAAVVTGGPQRVQVSA